MGEQRPQITAAFITLSIRVHAIRHTTYIFPKTVAKLTETTESFWEDLRLSGEGPQLFHYEGYDWFLFADVQDWLVANVCSETEVAHD